MTTTSNLPQTTILTANTLFVVSENRSLKVLPYSKILSSQKGFTGSIGRAGFTGSLGPRGYSGSRGIGYTGSAGAGVTGSRGLIGFTGSAGADGNSVTFDNLAFSLLPSTNNFYNIGSVTKRWRSVYAGTLYIDYTQGGIRDITTGQLINFSTGTSQSTGTVAIDWQNIPNSILPSTGAVYDIGNRQKWWRTLSVNEIYIGPDRFKDLTTGLPINIGGYTGSAGPAGSPGGFVGSRGFQGSIGLTGSVGYTGSAGAGFIGSSGYTGSTGNTGFTGSGGPGFTGSAGAGFLGSSGYTGSRGSLGFTGSAGLGSPGYIGSQGYTGSVGSMGFVGSRGFTGSKGIDGTNGFTGSAGVGFHGSMGFVGSRGNLGYTGSRGSDGTSVTIVGTTSTSTLLNPSYGGSVGDGYLISFNGNLWIWNGSSWVDVGQIRGPGGDRGYSGSIGFTGSQGAGYSGSRGYTGSPGSGYTGSAGSSGFIGSAGFTGSAGAGYTGSPGQGDVSGPTNTVDGAFAVYDGQSGKLITQAVAPTASAYLDKNSGAAYFTYNLSVRPFVNLVPTLTLTSPTGGSFIMKPPSTASNFTFTLPLGYGLNGQVLTTNGSGILSWTTATGSGGGGTGYTGSMGNPGYTGSAGSGGVASLTSVTSDILPIGTDIYSLGSSQKAWASLYANSINALSISAGSLFDPGTNSSITISSLVGLNLNSAPSIIPSEANTRNLGTQTIPWAKIYVKEIWSDGVFKSLTDGSTLSLGGGSGGALGARVTQQVVTGSVLNNQSIYADIAGFKGYMIYKITADAPCMVTIYSDDDARIADSGRSDTTDPLPGSGVMAEIITNSNNQTIKFAPALFAYSDRAGTPFVPIRVLNRSGATRTFTIQVTMLQMES